MTGTGLKKCMPSTYSARFVAAAMRVTCPLVVSFCGDDLLGRPDANGRLSLKSRALIPLSRWAARRADGVAAPGSRELPCELAVVGLQDDLPRVTHIAYEHGAYNTPPVAGSERYSYAREEDVDGLVASVLLDVRARMPFVPASSACQVASRPAPTAVSRPTPVTTTRRSSAIRHRSISRR